MKFIEIWTLIFWLTKTLFLKFFAYKEDINVLLLFTKPKYSLEIIFYIFLITQACNGVNSTDGEVIDDYGLWIGSKSIHRVDFLELLINQFFALTKKRFIHSARNLTLIVSQLVIPIAVLLINLLYLKYAPIKPGDSPILQMDISRYGNNFVPYDLRSNQTWLAELSQVYASQFTQPNIVPFNLKDNSTVTMCGDKRRDIDEFLSCLGHLSYTYIIDDYVLGTDFEADASNNATLIGHFNNQPFHVPPLTVNLLTNTLYKVRLSQVCQNSFYKSFLIGWSFLSIICWKILKNEGFILNSYQYILENSSTGVSLLFFCSFK